MYKIGDYVVYKRDVCEVVAVKEKKFNDEDYYSIVPIDDESLKIDIPTSNKSGHLRDLISKEEVEKIINNIPNVNIIKTNEKFIESEYKSLMNTGNHDDLVKIIKTTYLRNKEKLDNKKKIGDKDNNYFKAAEKYLYNEFSVVLDMDYEDTKNYVIDKVGQLTK